MNGLEVTRVIERFFGTLMEQYGIKFVRNFANDDIFFFGGHDYVIIPLYITPRGVVEALTINQTDSMNEIELHVVRIIELIRARQVEDGLSGFIFGQKEPEVPHTSGPVRRIKV